MTTTIWLFEVVLTIVMLVSGLAKTFLSKRRLIDSGQSGVAEFSASMIRFIGISELLGAAGMAVPAFMKGQAWAKPAAALGFCIVMVLAFRVHMKLRERASSAAVRSTESRNRVTNVVLFVLSAAVVAFRTWELLR